jgi:hypothetical protein
MVPEVGLEPTRREAGDFESPMYTNFITQAKTCKLYLACFAKKSAVRKYLCKTNHSINQLMLSQLSVGDYTFAFNNRKYFTYYFYKKHSIAQKSFIVPNNNG